jgi:predicted O-methyltransferase YrrM
MPRRLDNLIRYGALRANGAATRILALLATQARNLEARIDGIGSLELAPLIDIPVPRVDLAAHDDPVPLILDDPSYRAAVEYFTRHGSLARSLFSFEGQALLHVLVRNLRPDHVVEIGVFKAVTTEALARALHANGRGVIHAVDPFRSEYIGAILSRWPASLAAHLKFHPRDSVQFFAELRRSDIRPSLVFIDGDHDYEFASFDLESAARVLTGGGFIAVDNIAQPGPFFAVRDFLDRHPGWLECGGSTADYDATRAFDTSRARIHGTDLILLRAPRQRTIWGRPWSPGETRNSSGRVAGVRVTVGHPCGPGTLHAQVILRGFGAQLTEVSATASASLDDKTADVTVPLADPLTTTGDTFRVEPILTWQGDRPLRLARDPEVF